MRAPVSARVTIAVLLIATAPVLAQSPATPVQATARIVSAAQAVVATLDDAGRAKVQYPWGGPQKTRWSNLPTPLFERQGLRLADLTPVQRDAVTKLLMVAFSASGYRKVTEIMHGDEVWDRFQGKRDGSLWYYEAVAGVLAQRYRAPLTRDLLREVEALRHLADNL